MEETRGSGGETVSRQERVLYLYDVPDSLSGFGVKEVGLVELTAEEEMMATRRCRGDAVRLGFELAKEALRRVDGRSVSTSVGSTDSAWNQMHPKVRSLVVQAYNDLHGTKQEETASFIRSRRAHIG